MGNGTPDGDRAAGELSDVAMFQISERDGYWRGHVIFNGGEVELVEVDSSLSFFEAATTVLDIACQWPADAGRLVAEVEDFLGIG